MRSFLFSCGLCFAIVASAQAQLLEGEFDDIQLGRELIEPLQFPTIRELRAAVAEPKLRFVMMFKLYGDDNNHHLPIWSQDGRRLAFQRSRLGVNSSKLLLFESLADQPRLLSEEGPVYDYMFRWGINSASSFIFARIEAEAEETRLYYSNGDAPQPRTQAGGKFFYPSLYERTDGVHWLAYERQGEIVHDAWTDSQATSRVVARGTSPRWSSDGRRLLLARQSGGDRRSPAYDIVVRHLTEERDDALSSKPRVVVRSPTWSPDETRVAFFESDARDNAPWRIQVATADGSGTPLTVASDVIVNPDFKSEGPSWEPSGQRIWCFSHAHREQEFFPLVAANAATGTVTLVNYPRRATSPNDLAVNPVTAVPELAFVAHDGTTRDLFIVFLNHY